MFSGQGNIEGKGRPKERVVGRSQKNHRYLWLGVLGPRREASACAWRPGSARPPALRPQDVRCLVVAVQPPARWSRPHRLPSGRRAIKCLYVATPSYLSSGQRCRQGPRGPAVTSTPRSPVTVTNLPPHPTQLRLCPARRRPPAAVSPEANTLLLISEEDKMAA